MNNKMFFTGPIKNLEIIGSGDKIIEKITVVKDKEFFRKNFVGKIINLTTKNTIVDKEEAKDWLLYCHNSDDDFSDSINFVDVNDLERLSINEALNEGLIKIKKR